MEYEFANFNLGIDVSNGYLPIYNTPEFLEYLRQSKEIYDSGALFFPHKMSEASVQTEEDALREMQGEKFLLYTLRNSDFHDGKCSAAVERPLIMAPTAVANGLSTNAFMMAINKNAPQQELALEFIREYASEKNQKATTTEFSLYQNINEYEKMNGMNATVKQWMLALSLFP